MPQQNPEIRDLLPTPEKGGDFIQQIKNLQLSEEFTRKIIKEYQAQQTTSSSTPQAFLSPEEENELATEALILRHCFTEQVCHIRSFRQAAISIIQNIYLFANRRIFFQAGKHTEEERQSALLMLTDTPVKPVPLARSFQHSIIARIWERICLLSSYKQQEKSFGRLTEIVRKLNTIRNIYILFSMKLIRQLVRQTSSLYMQGITAEDATQIASFGVARAAYRFHPSVGVRFSTFSAKWIRKEIQRQALQGRLIRISSYTVEKFQKEQELARHNTTKKRATFSDIVNRSTTISLDGFPAEQHGSTNKEASDLYEQEEFMRLVDEFLQTQLPKKTADVIRRRYGLEPHHGESQSIIAIAEHYQVSRSSIYQLEKSGLDKLRQYLTISYR